MLARARAARRARPASVRHMAHHVLLMALLLFQIAAGIPATDAAVGFELYPAANPPDQAYWNTSLNSWGGSVYNDSVSLPTTKLAGL